MKSSSSAATAAAAFDGTVALEVTVLRPPREAFKLALLELAASGLRPGFRVGPLGAAFFAGAALLAAPPALDAGPASSAAAFASSGFWAAAFYFALSRIGLTVC